MILYEMLGMRVKLRVLSSPSKNEVSTDGAQKLVSQFNYYHHLEV